MGATSPYRAALRANAGKANDCGVALNLVIFVEENGEGPGVRPSVKAEEMTITPEHIKAARKMLGWSQYTLADRVHMNIARIAAIEAGKQPFAFELDLVREALESADRVHHSRRQGGREAAQGVKMGFRFSGRIWIIPGLRVNLGKRGASLSIGHRGAWYTFGPRMTAATVGSRDGPPVAILRRVLVEERNLPCVSALRASSEETRRP